MPTFSPCALDAITIPGLPPGFDMVSFARAVIFGEPTVESVPLLVRPEAPQPPSAARRKKLKAHAAKREAEGFGNIWSRVEFRCLTLAVAHTQKAFEEPCGHHRMSRIDLARLFLRESRSKCGSHTAALLRQCDQRAGR